MVSEYDNSALVKIRNNVGLSYRAAADYYDREGVTVLDIAPNEWRGASDIFKNANVVVGDINPNNYPDILLDICKTNHNVEAGAYDIVFCMEVLEHTERPWDAANEIWRILKPGGIAVVTTPFNFRIHGPLPDGWKEGDQVSDFWRFTEHGLILLFGRFQSVSIKRVESDRNLMPYGYTTIAQK